MDRGGNIEELIGSGLDLVSSLIPRGSTVMELRSFMEQMLEQLIHSAHASILFLVQVSMGEGDGECGGGGGVGGMDCAWRERKGMGRMEEEKEVYKGEGN